MQYWRMQKRASLIQRRLLDQFPVITAIWPAGAKLSHRLAHTARGPPPD